MKKIGVIIIVLIGTILLIVILNTFFLWRSLVKDSGKDPFDHGFIISYLIPLAFAGVFSIFLIRYGMRILRKKVEKKNLTGL